MLLPVGASQGLVGSLVLNFHYVNAILPLIPKKKNKLFASNLIHNSKLKHVEVEIHVTRKKVAKGEMTLQFVHVFPELLADILTKDLC